jgi:DNA-binding PadR family transcriptional regulator
MRPVIAEHDPLSEPVFLILTSLAEEPRHGYALIKDIEHLSSGRVRMSTGTLYGALHRLLEANWIERHSTADTSRDKQSYRLTKAGRARLAIDLDRLRTLTRAATARLKAKEA